MAILYVSYFGGVSNGCATDPQGSAALTTSTTHAETAAATQYTKVAKIQSDTEHYIAYGASALAASVTGTYLAAGEVLWLEFKKGYQISAITLA